MPTSAKQKAARDRLTIRAVHERYPGALAAYTTARRGQGSTRDDRRRPDNSGTTSPPSGEN
jgi:hypothetical protein